MTRSTYCTNCKKNVEMIEEKYLKLANSRLVIEGYCSVCKIKLLKAKVMPQSGKKPHTKWRKRH
ncbi:MAG: DUF5679 domain-containing protein [Nitrososphaeraceae archaeon]